MQDWKLEPARDLALSPGKRLRSYRRENGLLETAGHFVWWSLVRGYLALWHRLTVQGREHLPHKPPFVLVGNHTSQLDALVLASPLPSRLRDQTFPIAAGDNFFETPTMAVFSAFFLNALPIWRFKAGPHALQQLRERLLEERCIYILFPEGTRSRDGKLARFKPGLGMLVAGTDVPVVPCYMDGVFRAMPPKQRLPRPSRITLKIGAPLRFPAAANERPGWEEVARATEAAVRQLSGADKECMSPGKPSA